MQRHDETGKDDAKRFRLSVTQSTQGWRVVERSSSLLYNKVMQLMRDVGQETIASEKFDASPGATPSEEARLYRPHAKPFASLCPLLCPNKKIQQIQIQTRKAANQLNSEQEDEPVDDGEIGRASCRER